MKKLGREEEIENDSASGRKEGRKEVSKLSLQEQAQKPTRAVWGEKNNN